EAEAAFRQAQTLEPMNAEAAVGRGNAQFTLGQVDEAIGSYRRALAIEPNNAAVLFKIGSALLNTGRWEEALPALSKSVSLDGQNARAYANFGIALFNAGQLAPAVQAAQTAIALDPGLQIGRLLSGILASEQGHLDDALAILKEATRSKGENAEALITLAAVAAASGEILEAERALQRALADDGHMLEARHLLAALHDEAIVAPLDGYVAQMFDRIAPQYDAYQLNVAAYQVPQELVGIIEDTQPDRRSIASIIDAGCGTGLTVAALQDAFAIDAAIGIDCSQRMLEQAQTKGLYEEVLLGTLPDAFDALSGQVELITATDLFPYLGDLAPFMALAGQHLIPGGLLACS
ncbi:MAG: tetratricopeptide repeat protein, partial [Planctomycetales bacterium]|nr:tetratricopeptide repeat protein [Planctomycetales bacterium]